VLVPCLSSSHASQGTETIFALDFRTRFTLCVCLCCIFFFFFSYVLSFFGPETWSQYHPPLPLLARPFQWYAPKMKFFLPDSLSARSPLSICERTPFRVVFLFGSPNFSVVRRPASRSIFPFDSLSRVR